MRFPKDIYICPNYIDTDLFTPHASSKPVPRSNSILFVGRLVAEKNLFTLLDLSKATNLPCYIYGEGPLKQELIDYAQKHHIQCHMRGKVENHLLPSVYRQHLYFILPSFTEGLPKVLLEAMSSGSICIVTPFDGSGVITNGVDGFISNSFSLQSLLDAFEKAYFSHQKSSISQRARHKIVANYSFQHFFDIRSHFYKLSLSK